MSAPSPSDTKREKPMPRLLAQSSTPVTSAPDCETKASLPGSAPIWAKLALRPMPGTSMPTQFGPSMRSSEGRAASSMRCFRLTPWLSRSAPRPAVRTTAARVPRSPNAAISPGTVCGGVQTMARSGVLGRDATSLYTGLPDNARYFGLTA